MRIKKAFTMAEAILVMVILGIIAAIMIQTSRPAEFKNKGLKTLAMTAYGDLDGALTRTIIDDTQGYNKLSYLTDGSATNSSASVLRDKMKKYISMNRATVASTSYANDSTEVTFMLKNGVNVGLKKDSTTNIPANASCIPGESEAYGTAFKPGWGYMKLDVNGDDAPNVICIDRYLIPINDDGSTTGD